MANHLIDWMQKLGRPRILVLGDLMLDRYIFGDAERISQEAPVILLRADKREDRLGGASSFATMMAALEAEVHLVGVTGDDADAERVRSILTDLSVDCSGVLPDASRPTTVKERYIGRAQDRHPQQMMRVDYESRAVIEGAMEQKMADAIVAGIEKADVVLISDYDKGVCTSRLLKVAIEAGRKRGIPVVADPIRGKDYSKYRGCSAMTPNRLEAGLATGRMIGNNDDAMISARILRDSLGLDASIITLDKDGMAFCPRDGSEEIFPTRARAVYDITGAGDMVMSMLGLALAAGADYPTAIRLANIAGGLEVEKLGVATVSRDEIIQDIIQHSVTADGHERKLKTLVQLLPEIEQRRRAGQKVAFTNGCFDILHAGHVQYLQEARAQGDFLIVGLNADASIRQLKGPDRPLNTVDDRAAVLAGLQSVDYVTVFNESTPVNLIQAIRPHVLVKGADYRKEEVVGAKFVEANGGRVHLAGLKEGFSTTSIMKRKKAA